MSVHVDDIKIVGRRERLGLVLHDRTDPRCRFSYIWVAPREKEKLIVMLFPRLTTTRGSRAKSKRKVTLLFHRSLRESTTRNATPKRGSKSTEDWPEYVSEYSPRKRGAWMTANFALEDFNGTGELAPMRAQIVFECLHLARVGPDLPWTVNMFTLSVTNWNKACDETLARLISNIKQTKCY